MRLRLGKDVGSHSQVIPAFRLGHPRGMALITRIIQHEGDRQVGKPLDELIEQCDHTLKVDVSVIGDRDDLVRDRVPIQALTSGGGCRQEKTGQTPPGTQRGAQDKVRRIDEKDLAAPRLGRVENGGEFGIQE